MKIDDFISGYVDGLKDTGQWLEMTKEEKLQAGKDAIAYGEKMVFSFNQIFSIAESINSDLNKIGLKDINELTNEHVQRARAVTTNPRANSG